MSDAERVAVICVASLGEYRRPVMEDVMKAMGDRLRIYSDSSAVDPTVRVIQPPELGIRRARVYSLGGVAWQSLPWADVLRAGTLMLDLNPRLLNVWLLLMIRKIMRGRRTILWGHAWPRLGRDSRSERTRHRMRALSDCIVAYTESQAQELRDMHPGKTIIAAPNALYRRSQFAFEAHQDRNTFIYVGRLVAEKKVDLLIDAFSLLGEKCAGLRLVIVGDGPELAGLESRALRLAVSESVDFLGHQSDPEFLRQEYAHAIASISPGYVGLSVTQSLSHGVPMLISRDEPHAPELEAVKEGVNCAFFESGNAHSLSSLMLDAAKHRADLETAGGAIAKEAAARYSVERMASGLIEALEGNCP